MVAIITYKRRHKEVNPVYVGVFSPEAKCLEDVPLVSLKLSFPIPKEWAKDTVLNAPVVKGSVEDFLSIDGLVEFNKNGNVTIKVSLKAKRMKNQGKNLLINISSGKEGEEDYISRTIPIILFEAVDGKLNWLNIVMADYTDLILGNDLSRLSIENDKFVYVTAGTYQDLNHLFFYMDDNEKNLQNQRRLVRFNGFPALARGRKVRLYDYAAILRPTKSVTISF